MLSVSADLLSHCVDAPCSQILWSPLRTWPGVRMPVWPRLRWRALEPPVADVGRPCLWDCQAHPGGRLGEARVVAPGEPAELPRGCLKHSAWRAGSGLGDGSGHGDARRSRAAIDRCLQVAEPQCHCQQETRTMHMRSQTCIVSLQKHDGADLSGIPACGHTVMIACVSRDVPSRGLAGRRRIGRAGGRRRSECLPLLRRCPAAAESA